MKTIKREQLIYLDSIQHCLFPVIHCVHVL